MQLAVTGKQVDVTEPMRDYAVGKIERLSRHVDSVLDGHVVLSVEKLIHHAEATLHIPGANIHANADGLDVYAAIDSLVDKLDRQLLKLKEKRSEHR